MGATEDFTDHADPAESTVGRTLAKAGVKRHSTLYRPADFEEKKADHRRFSGMMARSFTATSKTQIPQEQGKYIINPLNKIKIGWDLYVGALIIYSVLTIPMTLSFSVEPEGAWLYWDIAVDIFF